MIYYLLLILSVWLVLCTVNLFFMNKVLKNHEALLYKLRDDINKDKVADGHIFCKSVDKDFNTNCKGITLKDMDMEEKP